jgi:hypothetical protein
MELNNLLKFEEFSKLYNLELKKKTKRTEIGGDVLNEHVYDKLLHSSINDKDSKDMINKLVTNIKSACKNKHVTDIVVNGDVINFVINKRKYCIDKKNNNLCLYQKVYNKPVDPKTGKNILDPETGKKKTERVDDKEVKVKVEKTIATEIFDVVNKCK